MPSFIPDDGTLVLAADEHWSVLDVCIEASENSMDVRVYGAVSPCVKLKSCVSGKCLYLTRLIQCLG